MGGTPPGVVGSINQSRSRQGVRLAPGEACRPAFLIGPSPAQSL
ncbi:protein of unknown function [Nitrospina watsonii]|uniref:Uncharacterized protein n=1 Tax=Nitrospina watsonii TaxID=1323948 RepID=A0ABN8VYV0_9BACT|nr:protein of unknown function [Nitrospina watsonii]